MLIGDAAGGADALDVCNRLVHALAVELAEWIGDDGFVALLRRALNAEKPRHACLADARVGTDADGKGGAHLVLAPSAAEQGRVHEALGGVLAKFIELFGRFVGVEMATRLTMRAWREYLPADDAPGRGSR
ncbi:MAG: hypothetical protein V4850_30470 [Myxococcota bacterium]